MDSSNPYAPPAVIDAEPVPEEFPWYLAGRGLYLRDGVVLPKIELETGDSGDHLIEVPQHFSKPRWQVSLIVVLFVFAVAPLTQWTHGIFRPFQALVVVFGGLFAAKLLINRFWPNIYWSRISFKTYRSVPNERLRKQRDFWKNLLSYSPPLIWLGVYCLLDGFMDNLGIGLVVVGAIGTILRLLRKHKPVLKSRPAEGLDGWIRVSEIHPTALRRLLEAERTRGRK